MRQEWPGVKRQTSWKTHHSHLSQLYTWYNWLSQGQCLLNWQPWRYGSPVSLFPFSCSEFPSKIDRNWTHRVTQHRALHQMGLHQFQMLESMDFLRHPFFFFCCRNCFWATYTFIACMHKKGVNLKCIAFSLQLSLSCFGSEKGETWPRPRREESHY